MSRNASNLILLKGETYLIVYMRVLELINFTMCFFTMRIIYKHSSKSLGAYKYCLFQIVFMTLLSNQLIIFGPIFVQPILGVYQTIDVVENPKIIHGMICAWIIFCAFDIASIQDGFLFRFRVLLKSFYPRFTNKSIWIAFALSIKIEIIVTTAIFFFPLGDQLNRAEMRQYLLQNYPNVVPTFDAYKSFMLYDTKNLKGFFEAALIMVFGISGITATSLFAVTGILTVLRLHKNQMSIATQKMHTRFIASVPSLVCVSPLSSLLLQIIFDFDFQSNWPGYVSLALLLLHGPLSSILTIVLYEPYKKAVLSSICRNEKPSEIRPISVSSMGATTK